MDRFGGDNKEDNKFTMSAIQGTEEEEDEINNETHIDAMFNYLDDIKISVELLNKLITYLKEEEFETDALYQDMKDYTKTGSNVATYINDESFIKVLSREISYFKSMSFIHIIHINLITFFI